VAVLVARLAVLVEGQVVLVEVLDKIKLQALEVI
jgi:hypothetical protein